MEIEKAREILRMVWENFALAEDEGREIYNLYSQSNSGRELYRVLQAIEHEYAEKW
jgi:hypothetical protein